MRKYFGFVVGLVVLVGASVTASAETFSAFLTPTQETPAVASTATGRAIIKIDAVAGTVTFTVVYSGLTSNQILAHIHAPAPVGTAAPVIITFPNPGGTSGTITGTAAITPTQIAQIRAGQGYVNVHSANFTGGEVRGQLNKLRPVDYDGDGRQDYSVIRFPNIAPPGVAQITYWTQLSSGGLTATNFGDVNTDFPAPGDYDGDGKGDICIFRDTEVAGADTIFMFLRSSDGTFGSTAFGKSGDLPVARDYDGDGITNFGVYRRSATVGAQNFYFYRTPAGLILTLPFGRSGDTTGGTSGDFAIPADYDGDGKADIAVYRFALGGPDDNSYIFQRSSDGVIVYQKWGNFQTDYILPGDYDGDGKCDFMVARTGALSTTPLQWWLLRSSDGATSVRTFGTTNTNDLPAQGDYDGDGKTDIAIWRRGAAAGSQSNFHVLRSFDGLLQSAAFGVREDFSVATFDVR